MKPDYNLCDICKTEVDQDLTLYIETGTQYDGVSGQESIGEYVDLCNMCAINAIRFCLKSKVEGLPEHLWRFVKLNKKKP